MYNKGKPMTSEDKIIENIATLKLSLQFDWSDLSTLQLTSDDRINIINHIKWCIKELKELEIRISNQSV